METTVAVKKWIKNSIFQVDGILSDGWDVRNLRKKGSRMISGARFGRCPFTHIFTLHCDRIHGGLRNLELSFGYLTLIYPLDIEVCDLTHLISANKSSDDV